MTNFYEKIKDADAAVVYITGQSNAHAHAQKLNKDEIITTGLNHVFTLDYRLDRSLDNKSLTWRQYTTQYSNLGEFQDNTCSLGYNIAIEWEKRINDGEDLPDLYIVQISQGCMGILNGQWNMGLERNIIGSIPLYHLALHINELVHKELKEKYKKPIAIGWHWIGSESDTEEPYCYDMNFRRIYDKFFDDMKTAIGFECPIFLYKLVFYNKGTSKKENINMVNDIFIDYTKKYTDCFFVDLQESVLWNDKIDTLGVFAEDRIHYSSDTQRWFGKNFYGTIESI